MIPIHCREDVAFVADPIIRDGLYEEVERLPDDYEYPTFGYFIVIESLDELLKPIPLMHSNLLHVSEPLCDYIEMVEQFDGYCQIVCILEADFGVVLFIRNRIASYEELSKMLGM